MWTVEQVKEELPDIRMEMPGGEIIDVMIHGRLEKYPRLAPHGSWPDSARHTAGCTVSWRTLVHCLNTDQPVKF